MKTLLDYNAVLDGITDDSNAIRASLSDVGYAVIPWTPAGIVAGDIDLAPGHVIAKERRKVKWKTPANANYGVRVLPYYSGGGPGTYVELEGISFDLSASPVTTTAIRHGTASGVVFGVRGYDLNFDNCGEAIGQEAHATNYVVDETFDDCLCFHTRGRQVHLPRTRGWITYRNFKIDHTYNTAPVTWEGARFTDLIGLELEKFDVVGPVLGAPVYQPNATGLVVAGAGVGKSTAWLTRVLVDNTRGPGILISDLANVQSSFLQSYQNLGPALIINNVHESSFGITKLVGAVGVQGAAAQSNGVSMSNVSDLTFAALEVKANTGHGIVLNNASRVKSEAGYSKLNGGVGIVEVGASDANNLSALSVFSNGGGSASLVGPNSALTGLLPHSGVFTPILRGPASI